MSTSLELRAEAIQAVRTTAELALADKYLNHSSAVVPTLILAGGISLFGGPFIGVLGIAAGIAYCLQNDVTYQRKAKEVRSTTNFTPIAQALKGQDEQLDIARKIWDNKGDLKKIAYEERYALVDDNIKTIAAKAEPVTTTEGAIVLNSNEVIPRKAIEIDSDAPHFILMAGTREGKTNALRVLLDGYDRVNYVSTKATDLIPTNWNGVLISGNTDQKAAQLQKLVTDWGNKLAAHAADPNLEPEWFVFDEAIQLQTYANRSGIKNLAKDIAGLQIEIATQGAAIGCYVVVLGQTKNAGPLGMDLDIIQQNFRLVLPLKRQRNMGSTIIEKIGGLRLNESQKIEINNNPNRYFQLWLGDNEDLYYDVLPEYKGELKSLSGSTFTVPTTTENEIAPTTNSKVADFLVKYNTETVKSAAKNKKPNAVTAIAYCKLFNELDDAKELKLSSLSSKSAFVSTLFNGGVIDSRSKDAWISHITKLVDEGYLTLSDTTISLGA